MSLNQLTENYTDSEDENESKIKNLSVSSDEEASSITKSSARNSPNSVDSRGSTGTPKKSIGGLVSYANEDEEDDDDPSLYKYKLDESDDNENSEAMDTDGDEEDDNDKNKIIEEERDDGVRLPLPPQGKCSSQLQDKVTHFLNRMRHGNTDWNQKIQNNKAFRNPSIYEKLIDHLGLDEMGSNYPLNMFDAHCWGKESFYDQLAKVQKEEMDRREKERKEKTKVDIISGTKKISDEEAKKRKSRFDQGASGAPLSKASSHPPPLLTAVPTGHKNTISAFGALSKLK